MEKISINNFAGIKEMDFEFKSINILIGPQGVGKSITVKLLYFFKSFFNETRRNIIAEDSESELDNKQIEKFITFFPKETWPQDNFRIVYSLDSIEITVEKIKDQLKIYYSENLKVAIRGIKKIYSEEKKKVTVENSTRLLGYEKELNSSVDQFLKTEIGSTAAYNQFFIPAGRSFFANIQKSIFSFFNDNRSLDPFLIEFGTYYESFKAIAVSEAFDRIADKRFDEITAQILNGVYQREKDGDYLMHSDSRKVNLINASSGQQETLPLIIILKVLSTLPDDGGTIYIEEPEAHLFPITQKAIVQLLARTFNSNANNFQIIVTTHSPYILSSFNNLLEAGRLSELKPEQSKNIAKIVPQAEQLSPGLLTAYSLNNGGKEDLIDKESKLITQTALDSVSNEIAIEFGKLLDIEF